MLYAIIVCHVVSGLCEIAGPERWAPSARAQCEQVAHDLANRPSLYVRKNLQYFCTGNMIPPVRNGDIHK